MTKPVFSQAQIIAQLERTTKEWSHTAGSPTVINYSYYTKVYPGDLANSNADYDTFQGLSAVEKAAVEASHLAFSDATLIQFQLVADDGTSSNKIAYGATSMIPSGTWGWAGAITTSTKNADGFYTYTGAYIWINEMPSTSDPDYSYGSYNLMAITHESEHAMGIPHPGDYNAGDGSTYATSALYAQDSTQYTIMSYWNGSYTGANFNGYSCQTLMRDDIAVLQDQYGANTATRTGNTIYGFNSTESGSVYDFAGNTHPVLCIWDAGGTDTLNFSGYTGATRMDLNAGGFSSTPGFTYNVSIALGVTIENAVGGLGNDTIFAGTGVNSINGGAGDDLIVFDSTHNIDPSFPEYGTAADTLTADDTVVGGAGNDTVELHGDYSGGLVLGSQTITGVETLKLDDGYDYNIALNSNTVAAGQTLTVDASALTGGHTAIINGTAETDGNFVMRGGAGNDYFMGGSGSDTFEGGAGNDTLSGGGGIDFASYQHAGSGVAVDLSEATHTVPGFDTDTFVSIEGLIGSAYDDTLIGDTGNNVIEGGLGNDSLAGGGGNDTVSYANSSAAVTVNLSTGSVTGGEGSDTLSGFSGVIGSAYNDTFIGSSADETFDGGAGIDTVDYSAATSSVLIDLTWSGSQTAGGGQGLDTLANIENVIGSAYDDSLTGNAGNNTFVGGAGNDVIDGGGGSDTVSYAAATGAVTVNLATTMLQTIGGGQGNDTLSHIENIVGSDYADTLTGDAGNNTFTPGAGNDTITGGTGIDTVDYSNATGAITLDLGLATAQAVGGGMGSDKLSGIEAVIGSAYGDTIYATTSTTAISAGAGDDKLYAWGYLTPSSTYDGGAGNDTLYLNSSNYAGGVTFQATTIQNVDNIYLYSGASYNLTENDGNVASGATLNVWAYGASAGQSVRFDGSAETDGRIAYSSGAANDTFIGGAGDDSATTSSANLQAGDTFDGGAGSDTFWLNGAFTTNYTFSANQMKNFESLQLSSGGSFVLTLVDANVAAGSQFDVWNNNMSNANTVSFDGSAETDGTFDFHIYKSSGTLTGGARDDIFNINAVEGVFTLNGGDGNDSFYAYNPSGTFVANGGDGDDTMYIKSASTAFTFNGGAGDDVIIAKGFLRAAMTLDGGTGTNSLIVDGDYSGANALVFTNTSLQNIQGIWFGEQQNYSLTMADGNVAAGQTLSIYANNANTLIFDGAAETDGKYIVYGTDNNDTITGGAGNDWIDGLQDIFASGGDVLAGGGGNDTVSYQHLYARGANVSLALQGSAQTICTNGSYVVSDTLSGFENIFGSYQNDTLTGDSGNNTLEGWVGNDRLDGGAGVDTASYSKATGGVAVNLNLTSAQTVGGGMGVDTLLNIENVIGGDYADTLIGDSGANYLTGGLGDDTFVGGAGDDTLYGGDGTDLVDYSAATEGIEINLMTGQGESSGQGHDALIDIENVIGSGFNDSIVAAGDTTSISAGAGDDLVWAAPAILTASSVMDGGAGQDSLILRGDYSAGLVLGANTVTNFETIRVDTDYSYNFTSNDATVASGASLTLDAAQLTSAYHLRFDGSAETDGVFTFVSGAGDDIFIGGAGSDTVSYEGGHAGVTVDLTKTTTQSVGGGMGSDTLIGVENVIGSTADDMLTASSAGGTLDGRDGNDTFKGGAGNDVFIGGAGVDTVNYLVASGGVTVDLSSAAAQSVGGGMGSDTFNGVENLVGSNFADTLIGDGGVNTLQGRDGNDTLRGGGGNDTLDGGAGDDTAVFAGNYASYAITNNGAGVYAISGADGSDTLSAIEHVKFDDRTVDLDVTAPTLSSTSPADNATDVPIDADVVLTFSEDVKAGTGNIVFHSSLGTGSISITDSTQVTISGRTVTVNPHGAGAAGTGYYITIDAGAITDLAGNAFAGISDPTAFNFTTAATDAIAPTLSSTSPADDAASVATNANIVLTFDEDVKAGTGNVVIHKADGTVVATIGAGDTGQVSYSYNSVTINPTADLLGGNGYYVTVDAGAITDLAGNAYAGISAATAFNFTTAHNTINGTSGADTLTGTAGVDDIYGLGGDDTVVATAGNDLYDGGAGKDTLDLSQLTGGVRVDLTQSTHQTIGGGMGDDTITGFEVAIGTAYNDTLTGGSGNTLIGGAGDDHLIVSGTGGSVDGGDGVDQIYQDDSWRTTGQTVTFTPGSGTVAGGLAYTGVEEFQYIGGIGDDVVTFDLRLAATGNNYFYGGDGTDTGVVDLSTVTTAVTTAYLNPTFFTITTGGTERVSLSTVENTTLLSGGGDDTFSLTETGTNSFDGGAGTDTATFSGTMASYTIVNNGAVGYTISKSGSSTTVTNVEKLQFSDQTVTLDLTAPTLSGTTPADDATNVAIGANLTLTFSEAVKAGTGNLVIHKADGTVVATIAATDTALVSFADTTVTINPSADLDYATAYYVTIAAGAITDLAGNAYAGITASTAFNFATGPAPDTTAPTLSGATPADNATDVAVGANLTLTFSEAVKAGTGNLVIHKADGTVVATIAIGDTSQVTFAGTGVTINPSADLTGLTDYYVTVDSGAITDLAGNAYAGISAATTWNFTSGKAPIIGTASADTLVGTSGDDDIYGLDGDDMLRGNGGTDLLDGGAGTDTTAFSLNPGSYYVVHNGDGSYTVKAQGLTQTLVNVEQASFDGTGQTLSMADFEKQSFNALNYIASYADLIKAFSDNAVWGLQHWFNNGQSEGRSISFDPLNYIASYPDLIAAFRLDQTAGVEHYIRCGYFEGRQVTFNPLNYIASYSDLIVKLGDDPYWGARHFIANGYSEGRTVTFDPLAYIASYPDLIKAFGDNATWGAEHYIKNGYFEGRTTTFNAYNYIASYDDLIKAFALDAQGAEEHYLRCGYYEGRSVSFDPVAYLLSNDDLARAGFTADDVAMHYIHNGYYEGRSRYGAFGNEQTNHALAIGGSGTSDTIATTGDKDWFSVDLVGGQTYTFTLTGVDGGNGTLADPFLGVYDAHGIQLTYNDNGADRDSTIRFTALASSTYYLVASAADAGTGTYKLLVSPAG